MNKNTDEFYNKLFSSQREWLSLGKSKKRRLDILINQLNKRKYFPINFTGFRFLDYGFGSGWLFQYLKPYNFSEYHGFDVNPSVKDEVQKRNPNVKLWIGSGDFPTILPSNYYDFITSIEVIEHIPYNLKKDFIEDSLRILKPGGIIYLTTPNQKYRTIAIPPGEEQPVEDWLSFQDVKSMYEKQGAKILYAGTWFYKKSFSKSIRILFHPYVTKALRMLKLLKMYEHVIGKTDLGLSMFFLIQKNTAEK